LRHAEEGHCDSNECYEGKRDNRTREVDHEKSITFKLEQLAKTKFEQSETGQEKATVGDSDLLLAEKRPKMESGVAVNRTFGYDVI
jgi:hypothetical protein